jgi:hypothetical protein
VFFPDCRFRLRCAFVKLQLLSLTVASKKAIMIALLAFAMYTLEKRRHLSQTNIFLAAFYSMVLLSTAQLCLDLADLALATDFMRKFLETNPSSASCPGPPWLVGSKRIYYAQWAVLAINM